MDEKYSRLNKDEKYDKAAAEEFAAAMNERVELMNRVSEIDDLLRENKDLAKFTWTTLEGVSKAIHNLDDDHVKNILTWQLEHNGSISKMMRQEARRRKILIPSVGGNNQYRLSGRSVSTDSIAEGEVVNW